MLQRLQELSVHGVCQTIATGTYEERSFIVMEVRRREGGRRGVGKACYREKKDVFQGPFPLNAPLNLPFSVTCTFCGV